MEQDFLKNPKKVREAQLVYSRDKILHDLFNVTILIKGINGVWEIIVGVLFLIFKRETIYRAIITLTEQKIVSGLSHSANNYVIRQANNFSTNTKYFIAFYFLFYGVVNIFLVVSLLRGKLWAYPTAILFFIFFILYQFYIFFLRRSSLLLLFTIFDVCLVFLAWLEYQRVKKNTL
jgi:uncharacterized membrane protein